jgi:tripartite-type tricarboxylate transporter receptor subunit TctC
MMSRQRAGLLGLILATFLIGGVAFAASPDDGFYRGKTIRLIVAFSAGGGYDTYSRTIARHLGKHIPGNPTVVVDNMTGAGGIIHAN